MDLVDHRPILMIGTSILIDSWLGTTMLCVLRQLQPTLNTLSATMQTSSLKHEEYLDLTFAHSQAQPKISSIYKFALHYPYSLNTADRNASFDDRNSLPLLVLIAQRKALSTCG